MKILLPFRPAILLAILMASLYSCSPQSREGKEHDMPGEKLATPVSIPAFDNVNPTVKTEISDFLKGYFALNQALIEDNLAGATLAAGDLAVTAKKFQVSNLTGEQMDFYLVQSSKLNSGLTDISGSDDIEKAREGLATVSEAMYSLTKAFHPHESTLYYQYCPMARNNQGANWISATKELVNPYMGQMMLQCGRTQETLQ